MKEEIVKKACTKCGEEKSLEEFNKQKLGKYGRRSKCKACRKELRKENFDAISKQQKRWRDNNKEYMSEYSKVWRSENREYKAVKDKEYRLKNENKIKSRKREYYKENKSSINEKNKKYFKKRYSEDPLFRTSILLRAKVSRLGDHKNESTIKLIGCSSLEFWKRNGSPNIEQLKNLHIDHIVPISWFNLEDENHVKVSSHWTNLQYLSSEDNLSKHNNYAGRPDSILGYKDEFDIEKHVSDMIEFINEI